MTKQTEALKLALVALEYINLCDNDRDFLQPHECQLTDEAITALREALAQPQQEPVAWMHKETGLLRQANKAKGGDFEPNHWTPLYTAIEQALAAPVQERYCSQAEQELYDGEDADDDTAPPAAQRQWVGLTDEQILKLAYPIRWQEVDDFEADKAVNFAQTIEAKLKEKNT